MSFAKRSTASYKLTAGPELRDLLGGSGRSPSRTMTHPSLISAATHPRHSLLAPNCRFGGVIAGGGRLAAVLLL
jgi:hypothetical protein